MICILDVFISAVHGSPLAKSSSGTCGSDIDALIPGATQEAEFIFRLQRNGEVRCERHRGKYATRGQSRD